MELTKDKIISKRFNLNIRGYSKNEVDRYLKLLAEKINLMQLEIMKMHDLLL